MTPTERVIKDTLLAIESLGRMARDGQPLDEFGLMCRRLSMDEIMSGLKALEATRAPSGWADGPRE